MPDSVAEGDRNHRVYTWANDRLGLRVGGGECWHLADGALRNAGARSSKGSGKNADYDWGRPIRDVRSAGTGDVLQFKNYVVKTTVTTKITYSDGGTEISEEVSRVIRGHHTAIVAANHGAKGLEILEQNYPEGAPVTLNTLYVRTGVVSEETSQQNVRRSDGKRVLATIVKRTYAQISGTVHAYRPEAQKP